MTEYTPDAWVVVKIVGDPDNNLHKVIGGWSGGYLDGDSWRINSGIESVGDGGDVWLVQGYSGSIYKLRKSGERVSMAMGGVLASLGDSVEIVSIETLL